MVDPIPPQIDYTSRDYASIRADLLSRVSAAMNGEWDGTDPNDFGVILVEAFAHLGDLQSYYIDRAANESALSTATRRSSVLALSRDLGYIPASWIPASGQVTFTNNDTLVNKTLPAGTTVSASVNKDGFIIEVPFLTTEAITVNASSSATVSVTQGEVVSGSGNGVSLGVSSAAANSVYRLPSSNVVADSVTVKVFDNVNYLPWTRVTRLQDYAGTDKVFTVIDDGYGGSYVQFGDGVGGAIPSNGHTVLATFTTCLGSNGNLYANTIKELVAVPGLTSGDVDILSDTMKVTNLLATTGGADPEDLNSIRANAAQAYRANNRAVTLEDYQSLALQVPGVGKSSAQSSVPGAVSLAIAPSRPFGGAEERPGYEGGPSWVTTANYESLKDTTYEYISSRMVAGVALSLVDVEYVFPVIELSVTALPSLSNTSVENSIRNAILERLDYSLVGFGATISPSGLIALVSSLGLTTEVTVDILKRTGDPDGVSTLVAPYDTMFLVYPSSITVTATGGT